MLVLPNAWDVASARAFAALPGCRAIATSSAAVARSLGWEDGERTPSAEMLFVVQRIAEAVDLPVTADLEAGYGDPPGTAAAALRAGAVGMNLEDSHADARLMPLEEQVAVIRAVREAAPEIVLNARVDTFLLGDTDVAHAIERGNAYLAAGADCIYPITAPAETIGALTKGINGPVNILFSPESPGLDELEQLGVARVTFGAGLAAVALTAATRVAAVALQR